MVMTQMSKLSDKDFRADTIDASVSTYKHTGIKGENGKSGKKKKGMKTAEPKTKAKTLGPQRHGWPQLG